MKWEYKKVNVQYELASVELCELGADGWELISVIQTTSGRYVTGVRINTTSMVYYFKRPTE